MITVTQAASAQIKLSAEQGKTEGLSLRIAATRNKGKERNGLVYQASSLSPRHDLPVKLKLNLALCVFPQGRSDGPGSWGEHGLLPGALLRCGSVHHPLVFENGPVKVITAQHRGAGVFTQLLWMREA